MRSLLILSLGLCALARVSLASPQGACSQKDLIHVVAVLKNVDPEMRPILTLRGIVDACEDALPPSVTQGIINLQGINAIGRAKLAVALLNGNQPFAQAACVDSTKVLSEAGKAAADDKALIVYRGCKYARLGLATDQEYVQAVKTDLGLALVAPAVFQWLVDHHMDRDAARHWARDVLGLNEK